ncbi:unnamed protein product, partial [Didymodactylos carnosus]
KSIQCVVNETDDRDSTKSSTPTHEEVTQSTESSNIEENVNESLEIESGLRAE